MINDMLRRLTNDKLTLRYDSFRFAPLPILTP